MSDASDDEVPDLTDLQLDPTPTSVPSTGAEPSAFPLPRDNASLEEVRRLVPVTLITGYLGSGKSTLVRRVLTADHGYRVAVIVNEYGDSAGIEQSVLDTPDGETTVATDWLELANGCLCCSVKSDFVAALEGLLGKGKGRFDYLLIETTGLANPGPVATALWTDTELESEIALDAIVTVVDCKNILRHLELEAPSALDKTNEAQQQLAYADLILLNKVDLVTENQRHEVERVIKTVNASAEVVWTTRCSVDLERILNRRAFAADTVEVPHQQKPSVEGCSHLSKGHGAACHTCNGDVTHPILHSPAVGTVTLIVQDPLDRREFEKWVDGLLWGERSVAADVFRMKGLLYFKHSCSKHVLQAVHELYEIVEGKKWSVLEARQSKLVLIGRRLDRKALQATLLKCLAQERTVPTL